MFWEHNSYGGDGRLACAGFAQATMVIKGILITVYGYRVTTVSKMEMVVWIKHKSPIQLAIYIPNQPSCLFHLFSGWRMF